MLCPCLRRLPNRPGPEDRSERGVLLASFALWVLVAAVGCLAVVGIANRASERAAAQAAADATALAGAAEGEASAQAIASANGVRLVEFEQDGFVVEVVVELDGVRAHARAEKQIRPAVSG